MNRISPPGTGAAVSFAESGCWTHLPPKQFWVMQSEFSLHDLPALHLSQPPPQSTSVSFPFCMLSSHAGSAHTSKMPSQYPDSQSEFAVQLLPRAHFWQRYPPQSTSASKPFLTWSVQDASSHIPPKQYLETQSASTRHFLLFPHLSHYDSPPQSTSVSPSSCTWL